MTEMHTFMMVDAATRRLIERGRMSMAMAKIKAFDKCYQYKTSIVLIVVNEEMMRWEQLGVICWHNEEMKPTMNLAWKPLKPAESARIHNDDVAMGPNN